MHKLTSPWVLLVDLESVKVDEKIKLQVINLRKKCESYLDEMRLITDKWKIENNTITILQADKNKWDEIFSKYAKEMMQMDKLLSPWRGKLKR
jgi:cell fate regulator YaaT (PSP1 superfamily)